MLFIDKSGEVKRKLDELLKVAFVEVGLTMEANAKQEITSLGAVDTGNLRNSITNRPNKYSVVVGTAVEYGKYVEFGTSRMVERPFLRNTILNHEGQYRQIIESHLQELD